ncbi:MAG: YeeE/YedE family protein [Verrucomicrobiales bacterium]|nr:YeeE/YedE family protein [Verrucomicrobiales bacterium]MCP5559522.1 YeeE/YedE family protein [Verrucomicrobiaceae bacterium]
MNKYRWNPYLVGALIGVLSIVTFALADKPIGMSTGVAQASGACAMPILGTDAVAANAYWSKKAVPKWDYGSLFVAGTFLGALISALVSKSFRFELVPEVWRRQVGPSVAKRMIAAFIGGAVLLYGARLADGCTSGHGISGTMQLAVSGWTFFLVMFATGVLTTRLLYRSTSNN